MKKIIGVIVLIAIIVLIGFGLTYKMVEPDGWDRIVETVMDEVPAFKEIFPIKTAKPTPTPSPSMAPSVENQQSAGSANTQTSNPVVVSPSGNNQQTGDSTSAETADPTASPSPSASVSPSPSPSETADPSPSPSASVSPSPSPSATVTPAVSPSATATPTPTPTPEVDFNNMTYEIYYNMSPELQQKYFETFENPMDFVEWHGNAKKEYDEAHKNETVVGSGGSINLGDYINSSSNGN